MRHTFLSTLLLVSLAVPAAAQSQTAPPPMVKPHGLPTVFLTDIQGAEHRGQLIRVSPDEVVLLGPSGERMFKRQEIRLIEKRGDSLKNGAIIGAVIGVLGVIPILGADCPTSEESCGGVRFAYATVMLGTYTAIGVGIDALINGRTVLYRANGKPAVALAVQPGKVAVGFSLRW